MFVCLRCACAGNRGRGRRQDRGGRPRESCCETESSRGALKWLLVRQCGLVCARVCVLCAVCALWACSTATLLCTTTRVRVVLCAARSSTTAVIGFGLWERASSRSEIVDFPTCTLMLTPPVSRPSSAVPTKLCNPRPAPPYRHLVRRSRHRPSTIWAVRMTRWLSGWPGARVRARLCRLCRTGVLASCAKLSRELLVLLQICLADGGAHIPQRALKVLLCH